MMWLNMLCEGRKLLMLWLCCMEISVGLVFMLRLVSRVLSSMILFL